jgi:hypothetical protein
MMRRAISILLTAGVVMGVAAIAIPVPAGAKGRFTVCTGTLAPGRYGRVVVPRHAVCLSEGPVRIHGGLWVRPGATFVLGDEEHPGDNGTIHNGVHGWHAQSVQIHFAHVYGGIKLKGGSGPFGPPFDVTWNTIEDSWIYGGATIVDYDGFWMGFIRNHVKGTVTLRHNVLQDPDGNEYVTNTIDGNMKCWGNSPAPQVGDSEGQANVVSGVKKGQCIHV